MIHRTLKIINNAENKSENNFTLFQYQVSVKHSEKCSGSEVLIILEKIKWLLTFL